MKKLKLLTSLTALLFVLSTTGCSLEDDSLDVVNPSVSESDSSSPSTSNTEGGNDDDNNDDDSDYDESFNGYYNYTLYFTYIDSNGNTTLLPDNAFAYVLGGWDNWSTYTPLTLEGDYYYTTFDKIEIATYRYKVVMWFTDEDVSWLNCVEITDGNQILRVGSTLTNDYFNNISLELNVSLPSEEERQNKLNTFQTAIDILEKASNINSFYGLWGAFDIEEITPNSKSSYSLTLNPNRDTFSDYWGYDGYERYFIYGTYTYEDYTYTSSYYDCVDYYFYQDGVRYDYYTTDDINAISPTSRVEPIGYTSLDDMVSDYLLPFSDANELINLINTGVDSDGKVVTYSMSTSLNNYILVMDSEQKGIYTYTISNDGEFVGVSYYDGQGYSFSVSPTTLETIETQISLLRASFDLCIEPEDFFKKVSFDTNYTVEYKFSEMVTDDYVTYGDYETASEEERSEMISNLELNFHTSETDMYVSYCDEGVFIRFGHVDEDAPMITSNYPVREHDRILTDYGVLLLNGETEDEDDCLSIYFSDDFGANWYLGSFTDSEGTAHSSSQPIYEGHWQDYCDTLSDCYAITQDDLYYWGLLERYASIGSYSLWTFKEEENANLLFKSLGGQFLFGTRYNEYISTFMEPYYLTCDPLYQEMQTTYDYEGLFPDDENYLEDGWEINDDTQLYVRYLSVQVALENFGRVSLVDTINEWTY